MLKGIIFHMQPGYKLRIPHIINLQKDLEETGYAIIETTAFLQEAIKKFQVSLEDCIVITDSKEGCEKAKKDNIPCIVYEDSKSSMQGFYHASMVVEGFEEVDHFFIEKVYCHCHHIPAFICETQRLILREIGKSDLLKLREICNQETSKNGCEGLEKTLEEEIEEFEHYRTYMYELCDMGYWCIVKKDTKEIIGKAGIEPKYWNNEQTVVEMGYLIDESYRCQGYAYEACQAIISVAKDKGIKELYCRIKQDNQASRMLAKKLGFLKIKDGDMEIWRYDYH